MASGSCKRSRPTPKCESMERHDRFAVAGESSQGSPGNDESSVLAIVAGSVTEQARLSRCSLKVCRVREQPRSARRGSLTETCVNGEAIDGLAVLWHLFSPSPMLQGSRHPAT
jgi:hypothetical protein